MQKNKNTKKIKKRIGIVTSDKMDKTIVVRVGRLTTHSVFKKKIRRFRKVKVHDPKNEAKVGNEVRIKETKPISKDKRWKLLEIVGKNE